MMMQDNNDFKQSLPNTTVSPSVKTVSDMAYAEVYSTVADLLKESGKFPSKSTLMEYYEILYKAAEMGIIMAISVLGRMHICVSFGVPNEMRGVHMLIYAAERGCVNAQYILGVHLVTTGAHIADGLFWYRTASHIYSNILGGKPLQQYIPMQPGDSRIHVPIPSDQHLRIKIEANSHDGGFISNHKLRERYGGLVDLAICVFCKKLAIDPVTVGCKDGHIACSACHELATSRKLHRCPNNCPIFNMKWYQPPPIINGLKSCYPVHIHCPIDGSILWCHRSGPFGKPIEGFMKRIYWSLDCECKLDECSWSGHFSHVNHHKSVYHLKDH